jgi:hypothetical protein
VITRVSELALSRSADPRDVESNPALLLAGGPASTQAQSEPGERADTSSVTPCAYTLFQQPWWLDAVAPGQWRTATVQRGAETAARLPYVLRRKLGLVLVSQPPLTQTLGPWLRPIEAKYTNRLSEQHELMRELIAQLPRFDLFRQAFAPSLTNWLPFYWEGFEQTTFYTYRIESLTDLDAVWGAFHKTVRTDIRKAEQSLAVDCEPNLTQCLDLVRASYHRQGLAFTVSEDLVRRVDYACALRGTRRMFFARDARGVAQAVVYLVWDDRSAYYLMGGRDSAVAGSGAVSLAMWRAIQFASTVTRMFDFEGSVREPIERFFRGFGPSQVPYFRVTKMNRRARTASAIASLWRRS